MKTTIETYSNMVKDWEEELIELKPHDLNLQYLRRANKLLKVPLQDSPRYQYKLGYFLKKKVLPDCPRPQEELWILHLEQ